MNKTKLEYVFHNPNTEEATIENILKVLIDANIPKVEKAIQEAKDFAQNTKECCDV